MARRSVARQAPQHALDGVRVLALEQAVAGPLATHVLADMGAEVIKVERPGSGDVLRGWDDVVRGLSSGYVWLNRAKRSVVIDAKSERGRDVLRTLALKSDVLLTNLGPGVTEQFGLSYESLRDAHPGLIFCAVSGYGQTGPFHEIKAYDLLMQGETGMIAATGYPDAPAKVAVPICDIAAASYAATAILMALFQRERTGRGQAIDIAMFDATLEWLAYIPHHYWHAGEEPERVGMRHAYIVPYGPYLAGDGRYVSTSAASARDWEVLCRDVFGRPDLLADERFRDAPSRRRHRRELDQLVEALFATRTSDAWVQRLTDVGLPAGRVRSISEVLSHPQVAARKAVRNVASPVGPVPTIESPIRMSESPPVDGPIPELGGDTEAVLRELGFSQQDVAELRRSGVAG